MESGEADPFSKTSDLTEKLQRRLGFRLTEDRLDLGRVGSLPVVNGQITVNAAKFLQIFLLALLHLIYMTAASATFGSLKAFMG